MWERVRWRRQFDKRVSAQIELIRPGRAEGGTEPSAEPYPVCASEIAAAAPLHIVCSFWLLLQPELPDYPKYA